MLEMKTAIATVYLLYLGFLGVQNERNPNFDEKSKQKELLNQYYQLNLKIFRKGSDMKDVESLFQLFTEDFTYTHQEYGGVYTKEDLYNGYRRNLESGEYDGSIYDICVFHSFQEKTPWQSAKDLFPKPTQILKKKLGK